MKTLRVYEFKIQREDPREGDRDAVYKETTTPKGKFKETHDNSWSSRAFLDTRVFHYSADSSPLFTSSVCVAVLMQLLAFFFLKTATDLFWCDEWLQKNK